MAHESFVLRRIRALLLVGLAGGIAGTAAELLLIGHFEDPWQWTPLILLGAGALACAWHVVRPASLTVRLLQGLMTLYIFAGAAGVGLHYDGNAEFELEMYPTMSGVELVQKTVTGATPVLAPGSMALLGLVGLACTYRHPAIVIDAGGDEASGEDS